MARIRTIKPEFWTSEQIVDCSPTARLLFIGLWNFADDAGRLSLSARTIKAKILPADDVTADDVRRMIDELASVGLIMVYFVENKEYLQVTGWHHQKIDRPRRSSIPPPDLDASSNDRRTIVAGKEGKGKDTTEQEGKGSDARESGDEHSTNAKLRTGIVKAFEDANSPNLPDTSRAELWISQGYDPTIVLAVVREIIAKKPSISTLAYFDNAIKEAHNKRYTAPLSTKPQRSDADLARANLRYWVGTNPDLPHDRNWPGQFNDRWGGPPGSARCTIPADILAEFGVTPAPAAVQDEGRAA